MSEKARRCQSHLGDKEAPRHHLTVCVRVLLTEQLRHRKGTSEHPLRVLGVPFAGGFSPFLDKKRRLGACRVGPSAGVPSRAYFLASLSLRVLTCAAEITTTCQVTSRSAFVTL